VSYNVENRFESGDDDDDDDDDVHTARKALASGHSCAVTEVCVPNANRRCCYRSYGPGDGMRCVNSPRFGSLQGCCRLR
jgi:hypothetical protein